MDLYKVKDGCLPIHFMVMGPIENNVYIISDDAATIVVDPTCDSDVILGALEKLGKKKLDAIILTHSHSDHVGAAAKLRRLTGATVIASKADAPYIERTVKPLRDDYEFPACEVDQPVDDGDVIQIGNMAWKVILTPGHTPGSMCLFLDPQFGTDKDGAPVLISGDTLFYGSIGRTDFEGGSMPDMRASLKRLAVLPDQTVVLPGHGEQTTIGAERRRIFAYYA